MNQIGIVQGRLLPPVAGALQAFPEDEWEREFPIAAHLSLAHLEWVVDDASAESNPILESKGQARIQHAIDASGVKVLGVCGDVFRDRPLVRSAGRERDVLLRLVGACARGCAAVNGRFVMIPLVDHAAVAPDEIDDALSALLAAAEEASRHRVTVAIESSLPVHAYIELLRRAEGALRVVYDVGDCASLGHDPREELLALAPWLACVHIKDRIRGGGSVPLGDGAADFEQVFSTLGELRYEGPITLQVARGREGAESETVGDALGQVLTRAITAFAHLA